MLVVKSIGVGIEGKVVLKFPFTSAFVLTWLYQVVESEVVARIETGWKAVAPIPLMVEVDEPTTIEVMIGGIMSGEDKSSLVDCVELWGGLYIKTRVEPPAITVS